MSLAAGARLGPYEVLGPIGAGGMGEVYKARDTRLDRAVAIKILPDRFALDPDRLARFAQEARTASSLNHPNIVTIHEIGHEAGCSYIVMEFVDGETLRRLVARGRPLSAKQTLDIGAQVAEGLAKAHAAHVVHRDLKPENVMITADGFAKILDFGLAKLRTDGERGAAPFLAVSSDAQTELSPQTALGTVFGTVGYMAPEQVRGLPADHRSDQFALGAILYELATGRKAFARDSAVQTLSAILENDPTPITELNPSVPVSLRSIIERCLAKEPINRYASTQELARELRGLRETFGNVANGGANGGAAATEARGSRLVRAIISIAIVLGILLLGSALREAWRTWLRPAPLAGEMRLAILFDDGGLAPSDRKLLAGLADYVIIRLADLNRLRGSLSVVPASELRETRVHGPRDAKRRVGANLAVTLAVRRTEQTFVVSATLEDTEQLRVIGGDRRSFPADRFSEDDAVELIVGILPIGLKAEERAAWTAGLSDVAEARSLFAAGLSQTPYQTGQSALERHDREQSLQSSIDYFNRAIELDPRYADAYAKLGEAYLLLYRLTRRQQHMILATQNAAKAQELDDTRPSIWITQGMIDAQTGAYAEAEWKFRNAIDRGPRTSLAYRELARTQERRGLTKEAEASYRKAVELDPDSWSNHNALGGFLLTSKRLGEAEQAFLAAAATAPDNARVWSNLGGLYYAQARFDEAEKALGRAIGLYEYGPALSNLATIKFRVRRQYAEAARLLERAVQASPRDYRIWLYLAGAYYWAPGEREREKEAAKTALGIIQEARRVEPDNPELVVALADAQATVGDERVARQLIARALKLAPSDGDIAHDAAAVYERLGDRDAALQQVAAALRLGIQSFEFESTPSFEQLVKDPRYLELATVK